VVTHRDPVAVTASIATMICYALRMTTAPIDPHQAGRYWAGRTGDFLTSCLRDRDTLPAGESLDVRFHDFMAGELDTVRRIYERAGQPFTQQARDAMTRYLAGHRRGRHGTVDYRLADLGLSAAERRQSLAPYAEQFGTQGSARPAGSPPPGRRCAARRRHIPTREPITLSN
jgi:Sulfotransferase family